MAIHGCGIIYRPGGSRLTHTNIWCLIPSNNSHMRAVMGWSIPIVPLWGQGAFWNIYIWVNYRLCLKMGNTVILEGTRRLLSLIWFLGHRSCIWSRGPFRSIFLMFCTDFVPDHNVISPEVPILPGFSLSCKQIPALVLNEVYCIPYPSIFRIFIGFLRLYLFISVYPLPMFVSEFVPTFEQK